GHEVIGVDTNEDKVAIVNRGASPLVEPGLGELVGAMVGDGRLKATTSAEEAIDGSDLALICVGTPSRPNGQLAVDSRVRGAGVEAPFVHTAVRTAEMIKYVANAFHALKVCFANEIADVCAAFGADAQEVMETFLLDRKLSVSEAYLRPGFAFGGSCLPKDLR